MTWPCLVITPTQEDVLLPKCPLAKRDGPVPHPADVKESTLSPEVSTSLWNGIHGGLGSGIQCADCHDADPIIHTPWIDGAKDENGDPVVPRMGIHDGLIQGFNEAPTQLSMRKLKTGPCPRCSTARSCSVHKVPPDWQWPLGIIVDGAHGRQEHLLEPNRDGARAEI